MDLIIKQIEPFRRLEFIQYYIELGKLIHQNDRKSCAKLCFAFTILALQSIHFLYQCYFELTPLQQIIHGDYVRFLNVRREAYLLTIGTLVLTAFYLYLLYMGSFYKINLLLESILFQERTNFYLKSHFRGQRVDVHVRKFTQWLVHGFQQFIWVIDLFVIVSQVSAFWELYQYDANIFLTISGLASIVTMEVRLFLLYGALYLYAHGHLFMATVFVVTIEVYRVKMIQIAEILYPKRLHHINQALMRFMCEHTLALIQILQINGQFGRPFVGFLIITCPLNSFFISSLMLGKIPINMQFFVVVVSLQQFCCNFGIHFWFASFNKRIHSPTKQFIRYNATIRYVPLQYKIQLDNFIIALHTRRRYGLTYHTMGRISIFSFVKYLLLYSQFLMFVYRANYVYVDN